MEYLLDQSQLGAAASVMNDGMSPDELAREIEKLRSVVLAAELRKEAPTLDIAILRRAYLLAALVGANCTPYSPEQRAQALVVSALIFECAFSAQQPEPSSVDYLLNAVLFYSKGEQEAQASTLARRAIGLELHKKSSTDESVQGAWKIVFHFLARDFKTVLGWNFNSADSVRDTLSTDYDAGDFWSHLLRACVATAGVMVWGGGANSFDKHFDRSISAALTAGDPHLQWIAVTLREVAAEMYARSLRRNLEEMDVPGWMIEALTLSGLVELWLPHREAIKATDGLPKGVLSTEARVSLVNMPTSAGKSLVAELTIFDELAKRRDSKILWIVPSRALVFEVQSRLSTHLRRLGDDAYTLPGGIEHDAQDDVVKNERRRVLVLTPEKLDGLLRRDLDVLESVGLVVVDEMHKIGEAGRGWLFETVIAWLLMEVCRKGHLRLLFMSAVLPNRCDFEAWLGRGMGRTVSRWSSWRPTRLALYTTKETSFRCWETFLLQRHREDSVLRWKLDEAISPMAVPIMLMNRIGALNSDQRTLVFYYTKRDVNSFVKLLAENIDEPTQVTPERQALADDFASVYGVKHYFTQAILRGVGLDHGDIPLWLRHRVERLFRDSKLSILAANQTVLEGVNFPIENLIVGSLGSQSGQSYVFRLELRDFVNLVGRAGRALVDTEGSCFLIRNFYYKDVKAGERNWDAYATPIPAVEPVHSALVANEEHLNKALERIDEALEGMEDTVIDKLEHCAEEIERLHSSVLGILELSDGKDIDSVVRWVTSTFAWQKASNCTRGLLDKYVKRVARGYQVANRTVYRIASLSGLSIRSARTVEQVARQIIAGCNIDVPLSFESVIPTEIFSQLVGLREGWGSQPVRYGPKKSVPRIDHRAVTILWIKGAPWDSVQNCICAEHENLAVETKASVAGAYVSQMFEYRMPWILGAVALAIEDAKGPKELHSFFELLPALIRYGVPTYEAATLGRFCGADRRMTLALFRIFSSQTEVRDVNAWLRSLVPRSLESVIQDASPSLLMELREKLRRNEPRRTRLRRSGSVTVGLAGWQYHQWQQVVTAMNLGERPLFGLKCEPSNAIDRFAVAVEANLRGNILHIGYIPRLDSEEVFDLLSWGRDISVNYVGVRQCGRPRFKIIMLPFRVR